MRNDSNSSQSVNKQNMDKVPIDLKTWPSGLLFCTVTSPVLLYDSPCGYNLLHNRMYLLNVNGDEESTREAKYAQTTLYILARTMIYLHISKYTHIHISLPAYVSSINYHLFGIEKQMRSKQRKNNSTQPKWKNIFWFHILEFGLALWRHPLRVLLRLPLKTPGLSHL